MRLFNLVDINFYAAAILLYILVSTLKRDGLRLVPDKLFLWMIISTLIILVVDAGAWIANAQPGQTAVLANIICNVLLFAFSPIPVALWYMYADYQIFKDERRIRKSVPVISALISVNAILSIISPFMHLYFSINDQNIFQRGPAAFYLLFVLLTVGFLLLVFIKLIIYRRRIEKHYFSTLLFFVVPPLFGSLAQIMFYGISILWGCAALSMLFLFINIQNRRLNSDPLTGVYNRRQLDLYIKTRIRQSNNENGLAGMMLDLNGFKQINDSFGHAEGDCALENTANILRQCLRLQDRIFRYGGDEFVVIMNLNSPQVLASVIQRVYMSFDQYNQTSGKPYKLQPSIGYMQYERASNMSSDEFIDMLDALMYKEKNKYKNLHGIYI